MAITRINLVDDATWARSWSVADSTERATLLATASDPLGIARGDIVFQTDTSAWYVFVGGTTLLQISDVAFLSQANTFIQNQTIALAEPKIILNATGQAANAKKIALTAGSGNFNFYFLNDDGSNQTLIFEVTRSTGLAQFAGDLEVVGVLGIPGGQIIFPATQVPSSNANTLDDYEEGAWTPTLGGSGGESGQVYSAQNGYYVKIGQLVLANFRIALSTLGTVTGSAQIKGFPFTSLNVTNYRAHATMAWANMTTALFYMEGQIVNNDTAMTINGTIAGGATSLGPMVQADFSNTSIIAGTLTYRANA